jgi:phosphoribosylanthranilate isomerase
MKVKICGITNSDDAHLSCALGAWALGFNFYSASPRCITVETAQNIIASLPEHIIKVGVFVDHSLDQIRTIMQTCSLDFAQVYKNYDLDKTEKIFFIRALQADKYDIEPNGDELMDYPYLLIDAPKNEDGLYGGTGRLAEMPVAATYAQKQRVILAGGLKPANVKACIAAVHPYALDVASGVEAYPGKKDPELLRHFFSLVQNRWV